MDTNTSMGGVMNNCGCGCQGNGENCKMLMDKIRQVNFALVETVLYLDAYPCSAEALEHYHCLKKKHEELKAQYEAECGPLTALGNENHGGWDWIKSPWPWHPDAN